MDGDMERLMNAVDRGGNLEYKTWDNTPLMIASIYNQLCIVRYLLSRNVELNTVNRFGWSALHLATANGHTDIALELLNAGIDHTIVSTKCLDRSDDTCETAQQVAERLNKNDTFAAMVSFFDRQAAEYIEDV